jgi:hypothetical protein
MRVRWVFEQSRFRLRYTDRFDDPNLPGEITVTVSLQKVSAAPSAHAAWPL